MKTTNEQKTSASEPPAGSIDGSCPKCKSENVLGAIESFWVGLTDEGEMEGQWSDYRGDAELGERRLCVDCEHES